MPVAEETLEISACSLCGRARLERRRERYQEQENRERNRENVVPSAWSRGLDTTCLLLIPLCARPVAEETLEISACSLCGRARLERRRERSIGEPLGRQANSMASKRPIRTRLRNLKSIKNKRTESGTAKTLFLVHGRRASRATSEFDGDGADAAVSGRRVGSGAGTSCPGHESARAKDRSELVFAT
jgi:ribosomal protein L37E